MTTRLVLSVLSATVAMAGCATSSRDITPSYVSPLQYQGFDCMQLASEAQRIQGRVVELGGRLDKAAENDKALVGVGVVLFWPALFFLGGTKAQEAEYGRLRGEYDAVQQAAIVRKCGGAGGQMTAVVAPSATITSSAAVTPPATSPSTPPIALAAFKVTDGFTNVSRTVEVSTRDISKGFLPGAGDIDSMMPPGGWVPSSTEALGRWSKTYQTADGTSKADLTGQVGPRLTLGTPMGPRTVVPVTYEGWVARTSVTGGGGSFVQHRAIFRIWYSPELGLPVKFESSMLASSPYRRESNETLELVAVN